MAFKGKYRKGYMRTLREQKREEANARNVAYKAAQAKEQETERPKIDGRYPN